ncbi:MAG: SpoIIE family protein phosphatase [Bacteroides sp.]
MKYIHSIALSFSTRLSLFITLITAAIFMLSLFVFFFYARQMVEEEATKNAQNTLSNTVLKIDHVLGSVEIAIDNMEWDIHANLQTPDSMYAITRRLLTNNPIIVGSAVAFEPNYYPGKGALFSPYTFRKGDSIASIQMGTEDYEYHYADWYQIPKLLKKSYWSEPYFDKGGGEMIMSTYSRPLLDSQGKVYAIFTADISLVWLTELVNKIQPYQHSYNLMIGRSGAYIVHPYKERILNETIFTATVEMKDTTVRYLGDQMINAQRGMLTVQNDDSLSYVFYAPIPKSGWSVAIVCPHQDVFAGVERIERIVTGITLSGLLLLLLFCVRTISRLTRPLKKFAQAAESIATGNFQAQLPDIRSHDEMRQLHQSFDFMQRSLVKYMAELKTTISNKERIESELRIASEIQMGMIPKIFPPFPERDDIDLYAVLRPAKEVGGDLYDFFIDNNQLYIAIGDVSGKGIPASLLMAVTRSLFRSIAVHLKDPTLIIESMNNSLAETNESSMFVTLFIAILDLQSGKLTYCNAGHNPLLVITPGSAASFLEVIPNIPIGVFPDFNYQSQQMLVTPGSTLFLYTDGLTEAENTDKELYSPLRLLHEIEQHRLLSPRELTLYVMNSVFQYAGEAEQSDDLTILAIKYRQETDPDKMTKSICIKNEIAEISRLSTFLEESAEEFELPPSLVMSLNLVLEEAVSNIIFYAYPNRADERITIQMEKEKETLVFTLIDSGLPFDPTLAAEADTTLPIEERPIGGLGLYLIKKMMDERKYQRIGTNNVFTLKKIIN